MPPFLALVIGVFVVFGGTLGFFSVWSERK
jgi:hypothetical protein